MSCVKGYNKGVEKCQRNEKMPQNWQRTRARHDTLEYNKSLALKSLKPAIPKFETRIQPNTVFSRGIHGIHWDFVGSHEHDHLGKEFSNFMSSSDILQSNTSAFSEILATLLVFGMVMNPIEINM